MIVCLVPVNSFSAMPRCFSCVELELSNQALTPGLTLLNVYVDLVVFTSIAGTS